MGLLKKIRKWGIPTRPFFSHPDRQVQAFVFFGQEEDMSQNTLLRYLKNPFKDLPKENEYNLIIGVVFNTLS